MARVCHIKIGSSSRLKGQRSRPAGWDPSMDGERLPSSSRPLRAASGGTTPRVTDRYHLRPHTNPCLAAAGRGNVDWEPIQGSIAQFAAGAGLPIAPQKGLVLSS